MASNSDAPYGRPESDPSTFFARTYITEGLGNLIRATACRLFGFGGEPVIQLQTNLLMEREDRSVVLIDHKVHAARAAAGAADLDELVGRYVSQLWWYQRALSVASVESSPVMCVAFPVQGVICEVEIG